MCGARGVISNYSDHAHAQFLLAAMASFLRAAIANINIVKAVLYITSFRHLVRRMEQ
jgi:hypothetical protein